MPKTDKTLGQVLAENLGCQRMMIHHHVQVQYEAAAQAVIKAHEERKAACRRCNGTGRISVQHGISFETDSPEERAACRHERRCLECGTEALIHKKTDHWDLVERCERLVAGIVNDMPEKIDARMKYREYQFDDNDMDELAGILSAIAEARKGRAE